MSRPLTTVPADTSFEAARAYYATLRELGGERRLVMGVELSNALRARLEAGVRHRHAEYDDQQVGLAVLRLMVGNELFQQCRPGCNVSP